MKNLMRKITLLLAMVVAFSCVSGNVAFAKTSQAQKAKKAYANRLARAAAGEDVFDVIGSNRDLYFRIANLNKDSIPELIISGDNGYHSCIYTYVNGKLRRIAYGYSDGYAGRFDFYSAKGIIYYKECNRGYLEECYYKFDGKRAKLVASKEGDDTYNVLTGKIKKNIVPNKYSPYLYKVNGKKVSSKKYNAYIKKIKGSSKKLKLSSIKTVKNTSANRLKKLGYRK